MRLSKCLNSLLNTIKIAFQFRDCLSLSGGYINDKDHFKFDELETSDFLYLHSEDYNFKASVNRLDCLIKFMPTFLPIGQCRNWDLLIRISKEKCFCCHWTIYLNFVWGREPRRSSFVSQSFSCLLCLTMGLNSVFVCAKLIEFLRQGLVIALSFYQAS